MSWRLLTVEHAPRGDDNDRVEIGYPTPAGEILLVSTGHVSDLRRYLALYGTAERLHWRPVL